MSAYRFYTLRISAQSPLAIREESKFSNFEQSLDFIPGVVLRGAVAGRALKECSRPEYRRQHAACPDKDGCAFWQLFGGEQPRFGSAYPGRSGPVYPYPLTARTCKDFPGLFQADDPREERHGVSDILIERFIYELLSDVAFPEREWLLPGWQGRLPALARRYAETCPRCRKKPGAGAPALIPVEGYYTAAEAGLLPAGDTLLRRQAHVGINRRRFVAEEGLLFTEETLEARQGLTQFFGSLALPEALEGLLAQYVEGEHYLGGGRSRGLGQVWVGVSPAEPAPPLQARLAEFNQAVQAAYRAWQTPASRLPGLPEASFFSLTLRSPALLEELGRAALSPAGRAIGRAVGLPQARLLRAWSKPATLGGWDSAAGLPRRTRLAAAPGSVYLYAAPAGALDLARLAELEEQGLGLERERGLGQVEICAAIHTQTMRSAGGEHD